MILQYICGLYKYYSRNLDIQVRYGDYNFQEYIILQIFTEPQKYLLLLPTLLILENIWSQQLSRSLRKLNVSTLHSLFTNGRQLYSSTPSCLGGFFPYRDSKSFRIRFNHPLKSACRDFTGALQHPQDV